MRRFLFSFCYETPDQLATNPMYGWEEEDSKRVFIEAESEEEALRWGVEVARTYVWMLYQREGGPPDFVWSPRCYRHWIVREQEAPGSAEAETSLPVIRVGELLPEEGGHAPIPPGSACPACEKEARQH